MTGRCRVALLLMSMLWVQVGFAPTSAHAQRRPRGGAATPAPTPAKPDAKPDPKPDAKADGGKAKVFDFTGLDISGRLRTPQLLYFLERASEELERASLERRSFVPEMLDSVRQGPL